MSENVSGVPGPQRSGSFVRAPREFYGGVVLMGSTDSYYAKHVVQHAALAASRLPLLANEIDVA